MPLCKNPECRKRFEQVRPLQVVCCTDCAIAWAAICKRKKGERIVKRAEREKTMERKEAAEKLSEIHKKAKAAFNRYIRLRDQHKPCVSCGKPLPPLGSRLGGALDCGHFRSVGRAGHLRYTEDNCAGQCKDCNLWGAGAYQQYREELIRRIGEARVLELECDNEPHKWTKEEVREIAKTYRKKCRELERAQG